MTVETRTTPTALVPALLVAMIVSPVAQTAMIPSLPTLAAEFGRSAAATSWVMTANLLAAAVATPLLGRLGDLRGHKPVLLLSLVVATAGALLAAFSPSFELLLVARTLQGAGAAVFPLAIGVIRAEMPRDRVPSGLALISVAMGLGSGMGVVAGGLLVSQVGYRSVFWLVLALGVLAVVTVALVVPKDTGADTGGGADVAGAVTLTLWLLALLIPISEGNTWGWTDWRTTGSLAVAVLVLAVWVVVERRAAHPLVDLPMLGTRTVALANVVAALSSFGLYGSFIAMSTLAQAPAALGIGFTASALGAGLMLVPNSVGNVVAGWLARVLLDRRGPRPTLVLGGFLSAAGMLFLVVEHRAEIAIYVASGVFGLGAGLASAAIPTYITGAVPHTRTGVANGMNAVLRTIGSAAGSAATGALLAADHAPGSSWPTSAAFQTTFLVLSGVFVLAALVPFAIRRS